MQKHMKLTEAVDYAIIQTYKLEIGKEFTISELFSNCLREFDFNKRQLAIIPKILKQVNLAKKTGNYHRTYSDGRIAGMAASYIRC